MRNIRLNLAYDGTNYVGWQIQPNGNSVQARVTEAIAQLTGQHVKLIAAGRTDAGVHALGQVANFMIDSPIPDTSLQSGLQNFLPDDIVVLDARPVDPEFHATYSATSKRYRYVIHNSRVAMPFLAKYVWRISDDLDAAAMDIAGQCLLGKHDFRSFESHYPNKATSIHTVTELHVERTMHWIAWQPMGPSTPHQQNAGEFICIDIVADGFLYNMVRTIVGTLVKVGRRQWTAEHVRKIRKFQDRSSAGETAPAQGLYLVQVHYDAAPS